MATPATTMNYPLTTFHFGVSADTDVTDINGASITTPLIIPAAIQDSTGVTGAAGQYLTAGTGSSLVWVDFPPEVQSLADILAVSPPGVASAGQTITGLASLGLSTTGATGASSVVLSSTLAGTTGETGSMALNVDTLPDSTGATKDFSRNYLPIGVGGVIYYLPLFSLPV
jgi:hypothetical protein